VTWSWFLLVWEGDHFDAQEISSLRIAQLDRLARYSKMAGPARADPATSEHSERLFIGH